MPPSPTFASSEPTQPLKDACRSWITPSIDEEASTARITSTFRHGAISPVVPPTPTSKIGALPELDELSAAAPVVSAALVPDCVASPGSVVVAGAVVTSPLEPSPIGCVAEALMLALSNGLSFPDSPQATSPNNTHEYLAIFGMRLTPAGVSHALGLR